MVLSSNSTGPTRCMTLRLLELFNAELCPAEVLAGTEIPGVSRRRGQL